MMTDPIASAHQAAAAGRIADAVALLEAAGATGNSQALTELAVWHLRGDILPRDLRRARESLRRAVAIGHVDAALMEIALTANGSGGALDWPGALSLLRAAAATDPIAASHLALVEAMRLDNEGYPASPPQGQILSESPSVIQFSGMLSRDECLHVAEIASPTLAPAVVVDPRTGRNFAHPVRTSYGTVIGPTEENLVIAALNRRFAALSGTKVVQGEPLSILRYAPGQEYRPHLDALPHTNNQRIATVIAYLNDGFEGGETHFIANGLVVTPRAGDVIVFRNTDQNGAIDQRSRHAGLPVRGGTKWIATRWVRTDPYDAWTYREGQ